MLRLVGTGSKDQRVALPGMKFSFREGQMRKLKVGRETMQTEKENDSNIGQSLSKHIIGLSIFTIFLPIALPTPQRTTPEMRPALDLKMDCWLFLLMLPEFCARRVKWSILNPVLADSSEEKSGVAF